jgi:outer membrane protein assembly factor BamB
VCVAPERDSVVVVGADGTLVANRDLADAVEHADGVDPDGDAVTSIVTRDDDLTDPEGRVLVTPDAALVRIDYLGDPVAAQVRAEAGPDSVQGADAGRRAMWLTAPLVTRDVRVRAEDAASGEVRWQVVLDGATFPAGSAFPQMSVCLTSGDVDGTLAEPESQWSATLGATRLSLTQCGLDVVLDLATGAVLRQEDVTAAEYSFTQGQAVPLPDGGWSETMWDSADAGEGTSTPASHITRDDGTEIGTVPGLVLPPLATDGPRSALLLTSTWGRGRSQGEVAAYDAATLEPEWSRSLPRVRPVARTRDVVVVTDEATVTGLDRDTGRTRWSAPLDLPDRARRSGRPGDADRITDALTDGHRVTVTSPVDSVGSGVMGDLTVMTTFDLTTGEVVWSTGPGASLYAIEGRLFRVGSNVLVALG